MSTTPRLFVTHDLTDGRAFALDDEQSNYLLRVLRLQVGAPVRVFNGRDGEWGAEIAAVQGKRAELLPVRRTRAQPAPLAPGLFVNVAIASRTSERLVAIPRAALKKNQYVYVVDADGAIKAREVAFAMADAETLYFRSGVGAGEKVVASFLPSPRDGMKVRDINARAAKAELVADADAPANR